MKRFAIAALLACSIPAGAVLANPAEALTVDDLRFMSQQDLNQVYAQAEVGPMPDGESNGTAVFFPDSIINAPAQMLAALAWQGKVFDTDEGVLVNKVFGFRAIKAEIFFGDSLFDGGDAIVIDYGNTSIVANRIRDEIRMVAPGLYLGRAYLRGVLFDYMVVNFILDFN